MRWWAVRSMLAVAALAALALTGAADADETKGGGMGDVQADRQGRWKPFSQVRSLLRGKRSAKKAESQAGTTGTERRLLSSSCGENTYYNGTECLPCPAFTSAPAGSTNLTDCVCVPGYFEDGQGSCPTGYYSNCTAIKDGECLPCRNAPSRAEYTSSGVNSTTDVSDSGFNVPGQLLGTDLRSTISLTVPAEFAGKLFRIEDELVNVTMNLPDSCSYVCSASTRMNEVGCSWVVSRRLLNVCTVEQLGQCVNCTTAPCPVGHFRTACNETHDGVCTACTNSKPENSVYSSPGIPYDSNACGWTCMSGYYKDGSQCSRCGNSLPDNANYSGPGGPGDGCPVCPWRCNDGYIRVNSTCVARTTAQSGDCLGGDLRDACKNAEGLPASPRMEFGQNHSIVMSGWTYHWMSSCPIGEFRSPCSSSCVLEYRDTTPGQCVPCTNACDTNAIYNSSGVNGNDCDWYCDNGKSKQFDATLSRYVCV
ncbi:hypothetical protein GUITHDRAFT_100400 [Guillardia theta CCMP2712]|uniref:Tyrosine-protein kinase ephrin type A/B receptor-like domain-containing protein n=1 Tax=Guillardia theta (strain CCMP2712) TaxID=905079 RepID=L1K194_GUITC|nr:hypothetical protein GUITHDRAFT_100400 [Guillardia theta CCMP2712]EKX54153.1 hypothetical protein GUITHDRAFT_100400 [Guillardia theta CCMP2712]|eukprot:XP_005841133.1 hypothetical protein GUITHDRAFT_100400 [Guillardia theta CCMP2712]